MTIVGERPTLAEVWNTVRNGSIYTARNKPWLWGPQVEYYDGWHFCLHCGPFSVELTDQL